MKPLETVKRNRGYIASDETVVWNLAKKAYLWTAIELRTGGVLAIQVSRDRGLDEHLKFMEVVKELIGLPTIYMDRANDYHQEA